jgi:Arc/MetJ-type ribon-helix-helix transcriptional regulator
MTPKPRAYLAALPLSALPELRECLEPFLGGKGPRGHVVMMRLSDEHVRRLDALVDAGLFGSRSEAAAFLVGAGIQSQADLFAKIAGQSAEIARLRQDLRHKALESLRRSSRQSAARGKAPRKAKGAR